MGPESDHCLALSVSQSYHCDLIDLCLVVEDDISLRVVGAIADVSLIFLNARQQLGYSYVRAWLQLGTWT